MLASKSNRYLSVIETKKQTLNIMFCTELNHSTIIISSTTQINTGSYYIHKAPNTHLFYKKYFYYTHTEIQDKHKSTNYSEAKCFQNDSVPAVTGFLIKTCFLIV